MNEMSIDAGSKWVESGGLFLGCSGRVMVNVSARGKGAANLIIISPILIGFDWIEVDISNICGLLKGPLLLKLNFFNPFILHRIQLRFSIKSDFSTLPDVIVCLELHMTFRIFLIP